MSVLRHPKNWTMTDLFVAVCIVMFALAAVGVVLSSRAESEERAACLARACRFGEPVFATPEWECFCRERPQ